MKTPVPFLPVCGSKFAKFQTMYTFHVPMPLFDCLCQSRFVHKIFAIKSRSRRKPNKCKRFLAPNFFGRDDPDFSTNIELARFTVHRWAKFG